ncbi:M42 family metallopeptidase [Sporosalibacterium faouarense]|uniref:M42 family metallopeptidase n=1 Tax=Sporosalibacterium faouarense TaxID=516123 RepID=UPI00141C96ED|nr:M42 family metallopeptidase [Sporosalibacterium faouarense]MTI48141.1 M42 family metallopeptidase [Bacillota bacterium]
MEFNGKLLKKLVDTYSPSGNEERIKDVITEEIKGLVDEIKVDALGNLIARKKGNGKKIMIAGHMDQIGLMITDIDDKGFLRFTNVGGISPHISLNQRVIFENGTVGIIHVEHIEDMSKMKLDKMFIDIGATNKDEAEKKVNIGDVCVYHTEYYENENRVMTKCLDDRVGCFIMIEALKKMQDTDNDVYMVFTVQEEVGLRGAKTSAYGINPDIGIAIDVTGTGDTPKARRMAVSLDKGTAIKVKDRSIMVHPKVKKLMADVAKENNIKHQFEVLEYGGTDSGAIHLTREGVPSGVISIPTRYIHSSSEVASKEDINNSIELLIKIIEKNIEL